jgi:hypothetical protein
MLTTLLSTVRNPLQHLLPSLSRSGLYACNNWWPGVRIFTEFVVREYHQHLFAHFNFNYNRRRITAAMHGDVCAYLYAHFERNWILFSERKIFQTKVVAKMERAFFFLVQFTSLVLRVTVFEIIKIKMIDWRYLKTWYWSEYLYRRGMKWQDVGENCIMRSFTTCKVKVKLSL